MAKKDKKTELDTSFIWNLKGLKHVGTEDGVDYYHVAINDYGAFVVEVSHESNTVDLLLTPIVDVSDGFIDKYLEKHKDPVCNDLLYFINLISEFLDGYKDSIVPYNGLIEMVRMAVKRGVNPPQN